MADGGQSPYPGDRKAVRNDRFIKEPKPKADPFADVGKSGGVDDPDRMLKGWIKPEAAVGIYLTAPAAILAILADRRRAVAIISAEGVDYENKQTSWFGTGFLVARNLLLTNHHVLNSPEVAATALVEFDYEVSAESLAAGHPARPTPKQYRLDPSRLFLTSPLDGGLDYTFVWIDEAASAAHGTIPMKRDSFTMERGQPAYVIHHPDGRPKEVSLDDTEVVAISSTLLHYASDTLGGSSGAPVLDGRGRLVALHHASREMAVTLMDGTKSDVVNEGIKVSAIAIDLERRSRVAEEAVYASTVLREITGSDTMSGFFGAAGRDVPAGLPAPEAVVATYRGTEQDVDVGFWNIEWLARRWRDDVKLSGAAKVITDLNLDLWGLAEVSRPAVEALIRRIEETYGDHFEAAYSEPDAPDGDQVTAMIWKTSALHGERVDWPAGIEPLLRRRSDDPAFGPEAVHGAIFDRYPGLFRFHTTDRMAPYQFYAVPLHLKAMAEGSLRRRLASRLLARAVAALEEVEPGGAVDVILGGDVNAPLESGDFAALETSGFVVLGAEDEREGAFTYLKAPQTPIDNVFLSPTMRQSVGRADYFIVAKDLTMPDYLGISDHRPVIVRLSVSKAKVPASNAEVDAILDGMLASGRPVKTAAKRSRSRRGGARA
jgi:endonuclease/exonuclease/phosphatase family metal-dependent hydrolase